MHDGSKAAAWPLTALRGYGLASYLALAFAALSVGLTWLVASAVADASTVRLREVIGASLAELAAQATDKLDTGIAERVREVRLMSSLPALNEGALSPARQRQLLDALKRAYSHYAWIGVADAGGTVRAGADGMRDGASVADQPWFAGALRGGHVGAGAASHRLLEIAFPLRAADGTVAGVIGAQLSWAWVEAIRAGLGARHADYPGLQVLIVDAGGTLLAGPPAWLAQQVDLRRYTGSAARAHGTLLLRWPDGKRYLSGFSRSDGALHEQGLGWTVFVLQAEDDAFAPLDNVRRRALLAGISVAVLFSLAGMLAAYAIARPLRQLARAARLVEGGAADRILLPRVGYFEVMALKETLNGFVARILAGKEKLREMAAHQERVKEDERKRIAREIHDELGSQLTGIKSYLSYVADLSARAGVPGGPHLGEAMRLADDALDTVRRVIAELRPSVLDELGLWDGLEWLAGRVAKQSKLACRTSIAAALDEVKVDPELATAVFRIVQEALTNVVRHAGASAITVAASRAGASLVVEVSDDGCGIAAPGQYRRGAWGLAGMHERARFFGGELTIEGRPGQGTRVVLVMPLGSA